MLKNYMTGWKRVGVCKYTKIINGVKCKVYRESAGFFANSWCGSIDGRLFIGAGQVYTRDRAKQIIIEHLVRDSDL